MPSTGALAFVNYPAPSGIGQDAGEPSIGVNWSSGNVMFQAGLETDRVVAIRRRRREV